MSWRYIVRLVTYDGKERSEVGGLNRKQMLAHVDALTDHVANEYRVEIAKYDPDANP